jgi:hypothetical protein
MNSNWRNRAAKVGVVLGGALGALLGCGDNQGWLRDTPFRRLGITETLEATPEDATIYFGSSSPDGTTEATACSDAPDVSADAGAGPLPGTSARQITFAVRALDQRLHPISAAHVSIKACGGDSSIVDVADTKEAAGACASLSSAALECITDTHGVARLKLSATGIAEGAVTFCIESGTAAPRRVTIRVKRNGGPQLDVALGAALPPPTLSCGVEPQPTDGMTVVPFSVQLVDRVGALATPEDVNVLIQAETQDKAFLAEDPKCASALNDQPELTLHSGQTRTEQWYVCLPCGAGVTTLRALDADRKVNSSVPVNASGVSTTPARVRYLLGTEDHGIAGATGAASNEEVVTGLRVSTCGGGAIVGREVQFVAAGAARSGVTNADGEVILVEPAAELSAVAVSWDTGTLKCEEQP